MALFPESLQIQMTKAFEQTKYLSLQATHKIQPFRIKLFQQHLNLVFRGKALPWHSLCNLIIKESKYIVSYLSKTGGPYIFLLLSKKTNTSFIFKPIKQNNRILSIYAAITVWNLWEPNSLFGEEQLQSMQMLFCIQRIDISMQHWCFD